MVFDTAPFTLADNVYATNIAVNNALRVVAVVLSDGSAFVISRLPQSFEHPVRDFIMICDCFYCCVFELQ